MLLSAVIITCNEQDNIARCLRALQSVADDIVVVDSLSQDDTCKIASSFDKVRVFSQKWLGYAEQKNYANTLAKYDTILSIDADEVLSKELAKSIKQLKEKEDNPLQTYELARLTNYCGHWIKHCGWYPDKKIRIFNRTTAQWQGEFVHETLSLPENAEVTLLKGDLLHYSYKNTSSHVQQLDKFTTLTAMQARKDGKTTGIAGIICRPIWKFLRDYFFKCGFLDGYAGFQVCKLSATATFLKYAKLKELNENDNPDK
ncbi:MAG: glycosyltransferase family 2 protein [Candidatus Onthomorpha sp.]